MSEQSSSNRSSYWKANIKIVTILLAIWAIVAFGFSIFFIEHLNKIEVGNVGLGFWFAQQGSIIVFVILVFVYAKWMDRLDRKFKLED